MTRPFPPRSSQVLDRTPFTITDFEPLLDSTQAARLLRIHPKTLQKMARRGEIHGKQWDGRPRSKRHRVCQSGRC
jgi:hypothetical protein